MTGTSSGEEDRVRASRDALISRLYKSERDWRFFPGDGGDPSEISDCARTRSTTIEQRVREADGLGAAEQAAMTHALKYFPIMFVSAPHIEDEVSGTFPGTPTPLLYATALLDRCLRIDEFPSMRVPEVVAVLNPPVYNEAFRRELVDIVVREKPVFVGISNLSEGHHFAMAIARQVKLASPETIVMLGGQHEDGTNPVVYRRAAQRATDGATISSQYALDDAALARTTALQTLATEDDRECVDFVISGDGQYLLLEFLTILADRLPCRIPQLTTALLEREATISSLPGSGFLFFSTDSGVLQHLETAGTPIDGNQLPFIDVSCVSHENRFPVFAYQKTAQVMACLGCKYTCSFCHESAENVLYDTPKLLQRTVAHVMAELELRWEQGFTAAFFDDSTFTQDRRWVDEMLTSLIARRVGGEFLEWGCQTTINDLTVALLDRMALAGCSYIYFGFESARPTAAVQKMRRATGGGREGWPRRFARVVRACHTSGIRVGTSLQFGLGESESDRRDTLDLVGTLHREGCIAPESVALNINAAYPGTEQWVGRLSDHHQKMPDYRDRLVRHPAFETAHQFTSLPWNEVEEIYALAVERLGEAILSVDFSTQARALQRLIQNAS